jgi:hypothetical protein
VGNLLALNRLGTHLLRACRERLGESPFVLSLAGTEMCWLWSRQDIQRFFRAPEREVTFRPAVQQFTERVFGLPSKEFFPKHFEILTELR